MDDFGDIVYVILGVVFLLFRLFKKKAQENQAPAPSEYNHAPAPSSKKEKSLLDTIREEIERQKQLTTPKPKARQPEIRQKTFSSKKTKKENTKKFLEPVVHEGSNMSVNIYKGEGGASVSEQLKRSIVIEDQPEEKRFEFDPREAFMMKTLLERPYS
ncbi:MAG: hypothetical protein SH857_16360 [Chitinophagales bacterium]|nr:hypothetical protein [Chitinophagales bacterium]